MQCSDGGSGRDGDDTDDECVDENETGEEVGEEVCEGAGDECDEEIGEELGEDAVEDGSEELLEDGEEEGTEEEGEAGKAEAEDLYDEDNPKRKESSDVSCLDSDSEETSQYSSRRNNLSESCVRKERVPKVRHRKVRRSG